MSVSDKWVKNIFSIATGSSSRRNMMTPVGFIMFLLFISAIVLLSFLLDSVFKFPVFPVHPLNLFFGLPFLAAGVILALTCVAFFLKNKGTPVPLNPPPVLIENGPYAFSRNPMITGLLLTFFGYGLVSGSVGLAFIMTPLFTIFNYIELKKVEEPEMLMRLGDKYEEYRNRVPMFIPKFGKQNRV